jgi:hypothetical protein
MQVSCIAYIIFGELNILAVVQIQRYVAAKRPHHLHIIYMPLCVPRPPSFRYPPPPSPPKQREVTNITFLTSVKLLNASAICWTDQATPHTVYAFATC